MNEMIKDIKAQLENIPLDIYLITNEMFVFSKWYKDIKYEISELRDFIDEINIDREEDKNISVSKINKTVDRYNYLLKKLLKTKAKINIKDYQSAINRMIKEQGSLLEEGKQLSTQLRDKSYDFKKTATINDIEKQLITFDSSKYKKERSKQYQETLQKTQVYIHELESYSEKIIKSDKQLGKILKYMSYIFIPFIGYYLYESIMTSESSYFLIAILTFLFLVFYKQDGKPTKNTLEKLENTNLIKDYINEEVEILESLSQLYVDSELSEILFEANSISENILSRIIKLNSVYEDYKNINANLKSNTTQCYLLLVLMGDEDIVNKMIKDGTFKSLYSVYDKRDVKLFVKDGVVHTEILIDHADMPNRTEYPVIKWKRVVEYEPIDQEEQKEYNVKHVYNVLYETIMTNINVGFIGSNIINIYQRDNETDNNERMLIFSVYADDKIASELSKKKHTPQSLIQELKHNVSLNGNIFGPVDEVKAKGEIQNISSLDNDDYTEYQKECYDKLSQLYSINCSLSNSLDKLDLELNEISEEIISNHSRMISAFGNYDLDSYDNEVLYLNNKLNNVLNIDTKSFNRMSETFSGSKHKYYYKTAKYPKHNDYDNKQVKEKYSVVKGDTTAYIP